MDLDFTADQETLRDSVRALLQRECPMSLVRGVVEGIESADELWRRMVELDWPSLTVPEACGGMGLGFVELAVVAEELGRVVAPGPLLATAAQFVPAVREAGTAAQQERFLGAVAAGDLTGSLAVAEAAGRWDTSDVLATARPDGDGWVLDGEKRWVTEGDAVDEVVVAARLEGTSGDDGVGLFVVPVADVETAPVNTLDASRRQATLRLAGVRVEGGRALGTPGEGAGALRRAVEEATVALAVETLGTCHALLDLTVAYAGERVQFGRPIGSFQAVKHKLADLLVVVERARAAAYFAAACIAEDDSRRTLAASVAKAAVGDAQRVAAKEAIQLHGGIAYTWEHDAHLYVKRAKSGDALFGTSDDHRTRVAELVADRRVAHQGPRWTLDGR